MAQKYSNNASTTLSSSITNVATSISVVSSATFPTITASDYFLATLYDIPGSAEINHEIIKVTGVSGTTLTVVRGQEGTTARSFAAGTRIEVRFTAGSISHYADKDSENTFSATQSISVNTSTNALTITQTGTGNALVVEDSANPDASPFVVDASGRAIFGHTAALTGVNIENHGTTDCFKFSNDGTGQALRLMKGRATTPVFTTAVQSGDDFGTLDFYGTDGATVVAGARITASVDGTPGVNDMPGRLVFSTTADGSNTPTERMRIDSVGRLSMGGAAGTGQSVVLNKNTTGATTSYGVLSQPQIQPDVTSNAYTFYAGTNTSAAAFTIGNSIGFCANQAVIGAASAITNQIGFDAGSSLTGGTNNFGFRSNIPLGTGRWNFYAVGTAANYFAGDVQLGKTVTAAGTTGAQTINKTIGSVNFAASATSLVVTNNLVTANSIITATVGSNDTTMKSVSVVAGAGSFTLYANAAPTAETRVNFHIFN